MRCCKSTARRLFPTLLTTGVMALIGAMPAAAQAGTTLTLSTASVTTATPGSAAYNSGFSASGSLTFTVSTTVNLGASARVLISAPSNAPGIQWASAAGGPWTTITSSEAQVASGTALIASSFGGTIYFRFPLGWTTDPPGPQALNTISIRLRSP